MNLTKLVSSSNIIAQWFDGSVTELFLLRFGDASYPDGEVSFAEGLLPTYYGWLIKRCVHQQPRLKCMPLRSEGGVV